MESQVATDFQLGYFRVMFITGIGTAVPARRYTQRECWEVAKSHQDIQRLALRSQAMLRKVLLGDNGVESRHLVLDSIAEAFELSPNVLHQRFAQHAPLLATSAARKALLNAKIDASAVDALIISTCTGYLCPGLTSYVSESLGLKPDALLLDLVGQGCGAALPNLRTGAALLSSHGARRVLSVCVEVCSAAFFIDDDPGVLISACLFGDGAAAAVLSNEPNEGYRRVEWKAATTLLSTGDREHLRFEQRDGMLRNILSREVPELAGKYAERVLQDVLMRTGLDRKVISAWIMHAGGRTILLALQERLGLTDAQLGWSAGVLREYGNLSSPCVLFVLASALAANAPGGCWWMSSFGAGFSCHGALLQVE